MSESTWDDFNDEYQRLVTQDRSTQTSQARCSLETEDAQYVDLLLEAAPEFWQDPLAFSQGINAFCKQKLLLKLENFQKFGEPLSFSSGGKAFVKHLIGKLGFYMVRRPPNKWLPLSKEWKNANKLYISRLMAPRWNCFAQVGVASISVSNSIEVDADSLAPYSDAWTLVLYNRKLETVARFGSQEGLTSKQLQLPAGNYNIAYRCYTDDPHLYCPKIVIDRKTQIKNAVLLDEKTHYQQCLTDLQHNRNPLFYLQQYYVFHWLKNKQSYVDKDIHREYLPVGNPDTIFEYGYVPKEAIIQVKLSQKTLDTYRFYISSLNYMSIPIQSSQVSTTEWQSPPHREDATYLIRCVPRGTLSANDSLDYTVSVSGE